jgi:hypothetical protein
MHILIIEDKLKEIGKLTSYRIFFFSHMTMISVVILMFNKFARKIILQICSLKHYQLQCLKDCDVILKYNTLKI